MGTATIVGGQIVSTSLDPSQDTFAQNALTALGVNYANGAVLTSITDPAQGHVGKGGTLNVYNIAATAGSTYTLTNPARAVILTGTADATINGVAHEVRQVLIGDAGNDTINTFGGRGVVMVGDGNNTINVNGGTQNINTGSGSNIINAVGTTNVSVSGGASNRLNISGGGHDIVNSSVGLRVAISGDESVQIRSGNDTITLGSGNDIIRDSASATVTGGSGNLKIVDTGGLKIQAGSGRETITGGAGFNQLYGSHSTTGVDYMKGGSGTNVFIGGVGHDQMISGALSGSTNDVFEFSASIAGGTHDIIGYSSSSDVIELKGYTAADISKLSYVSGNTIIKLDDGTSITVKGAVLTTSDIKFTH
jgi:Ca2+-binding RTX toxin-like protein